MNLIVRSAVLSCAVLSLGAAPALEADYVVALLHRGEARIALNQAVLDSLQASHMANIGRMANLDLLVGAGPMGDDGVLRGLFFFRPDSIARIERELGPDGLIAAGRLRVSLLHWRGPPGVGERYRASAARGDPAADSMAVYTLVLLHHASASTVDLPDDRARWRAHRTDLAVRGARGGLRMAGAFIGDREYAGLLVFGGDSLAAKRWLAREPFVRDAIVRAEYRPWWTAVNLFP